MVKLSKLQQEALAAMQRHGGWASAYDLHYSLATLNALVSKGFAAARGYGKPGVMSSPRTILEYKANDTRKNPTNGSFLFKKKLDI